jgi:hypothetical protein
MVVPDPRVGALYELVEFARHQNTIHCQNGDATAPTTVDFSIEPPITSTAPVGTD